MPDPAATVDAGEGDRGEDRPRRPGMRFTYATGDKPLEGYTIKRGIGAGGFGEVYYATSQAGKEVALKLIQRHLDIELRGVGQCLNLKHPNLVALYDIRYDQSEAGWVVMEYVSGDSLAEVIDRNPNGMPQDEVARWFRGIAGGVAYLHDRGIVHRDLKPGNVFIDEGIVKIGDYGLAKFISCSRRSGQTESVGTFHYMAPEIGQGRYGKEIDIYALGIILYEMLTGRVPFEGESTQEIIMKHLTADPDVSSLAEPYRAVISRALSKDPQQRFGSVTEMLGALGLAAADDFTPVINAAAAPEKREKNPQRGPQHAPPPLTPPPASKNRNGDYGYGEEPVAKLFRNGYERALTWWAESDLNLGVKLLIVTAAILAVIFSASFLIPLCVFACVAYVIYLVIRSIVLHIDRVAGRRRRRPNEKTDRTVYEQAAQAKTGQRKDQARRANRCRGRSWPKTKIVMPPKRPRQVATELTGSLLMAAAVSVVLATLVTTLTGYDMAGSLSAWISMSVWLSATSAVGTWGVLIASKSWEGEGRETATRRFTMLVVGLLTGAVSYTLARWLVVQPGFLFDVEPAVLQNAYLFDQASRVPLLPAYLGFFAALFFVPRWWRQADPLRNKRIGVWAVAACVVWSLLLYAVWPLPRGVMIAGVTAIAVQMSAPWLSKSERAPYRQPVTES